MKTVIRLERDLRNYDESTSIGILVWHSKGEKQLILSEIYNLRKIWRELTLCLISMVFNSDFPSRNLCLWIRQWARENIEGHCMFLQNGNGMRGLKTKQQKSVLCKWQHCLNMHFGQKYVNNSSMQNPRQKKH